MPIERLHLSRRRLLTGAAACAGAAVGALPTAFGSEAGSASGDAVATATDAALPPAPTSESLAARLHQTLTPEQRRAICFPWDHRHPRFGLLRNRVGNNWNVTEPEIAGDFYTPDQRRLIRDIFEHLIEPDWHARFDRQLDDDTGGFGNDQSIALLGEPGSGRFQFLLTGRHMTLRCDGDSAEHVAFGGPIFYGHDAGGFNEEAGHKGNVFWPQAIAANAVYGMLDGRQRDQALVPRLPRESAIAFRRQGDQPPGLPVSGMSADQRAELERVLAVLLEPFRTRDRDEVRGCLARQGGLDRCHLAFYREGDVGNDGIWDCWRLEGPSFVWYFRGAPHVHVWVNVADTPEIATNA